MKSDSLRPTKKHRDPSIPFGDNVPRIEPGVYEAICFDAKYRPGYVGQRTLYVEFRLYGGDHDGVELSMPCPAHYKSLRQRHKLFKQWVLATGRRPAAGERFTKDVFAGKMYEIKVRNTCCRWPDSNELMPDNLQYSIVETIIRPLTGVPVS